jgi:hypothetical protein
MPLCSMRPAHDDQIELVSSGAQCSRNTRSRSTPFYSWAPRSSGLQAILRGQEWNSQAQCAVGHWIHEPNCSAGKDSPVRLKELLGAAEQKCGDTHFGSLSLDGRGHPEGTQERGQKGSAQTIRHRNSGQNELGGGAEREDPPEGSGYCPSLRDYYWIQCGLMKDFLPNLRGGS